MRWYFFGLCVNACRQHGFCTIQKLRNSCCNWNSIPKCNTFCIHSRYDTKLSCLAQMDFIASWWLVTVWIDGLGCIKVRVKWCIGTWLLLTITKSIENNIIHCTEWALIITWYAMRLCWCASAPRKPSEEWKSFIETWSLLCIAWFDTMHAHFLTMFRLLVWLVHWLVLEAFGADRNHHPVTRSHTLMTIAIERKCCCEWNANVYASCNVHTLGDKNSSSGGSKMKQTDASDCAQCWQIPICYVSKSVPHHRDDSI